MIQLDAMLPIIGNSIDDLTSHVVYTLRYPDTGKVFYVGYSKNVKDRYQRHLRELKSYSHDSIQKINIIKKLAINGDLPLLHIERVCRTKEIALHNERALKKELHTQGAKLSNYGKTQTSLETRTKLRANDAIAEVFSHPVMTLVTFILLLVLLIYMVKSGHRSATTPTTSIYIQPSI